MADSLAEILAVARRAAPDVPPSVWSLIEIAIRKDFGATRPYIAAHRKRRHLEALASADAAADAETIAGVLGISVRRVQQLKKLR